MLSVKIKLYPSWSFISIKLYILLTGHSILFSNPFIWANRIMTDRWEQYWRAMILAVSPSLNLDQDVYIILTSLSALSGEKWSLWPRPRETKKTMGLRLVCEVLYSSLCNVKFFKIYGPLSLSQPKNLSNSRLLVGDGGDAPDGVTHGYGSPRHRPPIQTPH